MLVPASTMCGSQFVRITIASGLGLDLCWSQCWRCAGPSLPKTVAFEAWDSIDVGPSVDDVRDPACQNTIA